ncbi:MAG: DUF6232 family protein [Propionibacteriaceae bacterium]
MRTYYRGPDVVVTSTVFADRSTGKPYVIRDLRKAHIACTHHFQPALVFAIAGLTLMAVAAWPLTKASPIYGWTLLALGVPALTAVATLWRLRPQTWELWATYRGADVLLYSSSHTRVFNQVSRALQRAIEDARPPATWRDLANA